MLLAAAGCARIGTPSPAAQRRPWTTPHVLRIAIQSEPATLNPLLATDTTANAVDRLLFDVLVSTDADGKHDVPMLAERVPTTANGDLSPDGRTIRYRLRHGVRWHDGAPFTSADVRFSYEAVMNPRNNVVARVGYDLVDRVDTPDRYTIVFHLRAPFAPAVRTLFAESDSPYGIVPAHLLARYASVNEVPFNAAPIGTGPFMFSRLRHGDRIELRANPHYFLGKPKLQRIVLHVVPDENVAVAQLRTHEIDWQFEASPQLAQSLRAVPGLALPLADRNGYEAVQFNLDRPTLRDVRVRRAISLGIDTRRLVDTLTFGTAVAANADLPQFLWAHDAALPPHAFDPAAARALLQTAGYRPGRDGIMHRAGTRLSLELTYGSANATRRLGALQLQSMLREIGIELRIKPYLATMLYGPMQTGGILQSGKFDLAWLGWIAGVDPDNSSQFRCAARPPLGNNTARYCSAAMDAAQRDALARPEIPARTAAYRRIESLLANDVPQVFLWWPRQLQPTSPDLRGFDPNPVTETWDAYRWDI